MVPTNLQTPLRLPGFFLRNGNSPITDPITVMGVAHTVGHSPLAPLAVLIIYSSRYSFYKLGYKYTQRHCVLFCVSFTAKGQLISEGNFGVFKSRKK